MYLFVSSSATLPTVGLYTAQFRFRSPVTQQQWTRCRWSWWRIRTLIQGACIRHLLDTGRVHSSHPLDAHTHGHRSAAMRAIATITAASCLCSVAIYQLRRQCRASVEDSLIGRRRFTDWPDRICKTASAERWTYQSSKTDCCFCQPLGAFSRQSLINGDELIWSILINCLTTCPTQEIWPRECTWSRE